MELNADFDTPVTVHSNEIEWTPSPMPGVDRRMLDRIGGEVARATSIVRYAANSTFSRHTHTGGEEFIVLEGVFQDEHGDYPAGTYVRNPPTTAHTPGSQAGCIIFVKLWQFDMDDRTQFRKNMAGELGDAQNGIASAELHRDAFETVSYIRLDHSTSFTNTDRGGIEVLVIDGAVENGSESLGQGAWLRLPAGSPLTLTAGPDGADLWMKTGHLDHAKPPQTNTDN